MSAWEKRCQRVKHGVSIENTWFLRVPTLLGYFIGSSLIAFIDETVMPLCYLKNLEDYDKYTSAEPRTYRKDSEYSPNPSDR